MKKDSEPIKGKKLSQRVAREYLIREAKSFMEHKKGIPEWIKNSDDSYTRFEDNDSSKDFSSLPIVINLNKEEVACLDFGGADGKTIIKFLPVYGTSKAATLGRVLKNKEVSGGHGNGGKYYAIAQFKDCKISSYYKGKFTMLSINETGDYVDYENKELNPDEAINLIGIENWDYFNNQGKELLKQIREKTLNFFIWQGINPRDKRPFLNLRTITKLLDDILLNPQSRSALKYRHVNFLWNGNLFEEGVKPREIEQNQDFEPREFELPSNLGDFKFNTSKKSILKISLSKDVLTGDKSSLNNLEINANGKNIAYYFIPSLMEDKGVAKYLTAEIDCPELKKYGYVTNDRVNLVQNDVTRLFLDWCRSKIQEVIDDIERKEKKNLEVKELEKLGNFLNDIITEISELLEEDTLKPIYNVHGQNMAAIRVSNGNPEQRSGENGNSNNRRTETEEKSGPTEEKKSKGQIKILLSNKDLDPLNPGKTYDLVSRAPILVQRTIDVDHGIWWINTQKDYIRKLHFDDPISKPILILLIKEIVFSDKLRRRFKQQEEYDPDSLESLNFDLIDIIFSKVIQRLDIQISLEESINDKIRTAIKGKKEFTVQELSKELNVKPLYISNFLSTKSEWISDNFNSKCINENGKKIKLYVHR